MKNVYDSQTFFDSYQKMRKEVVNANNLIENPIIKKLMPNFSGKKILDLGCGDGNMDMFFVQNGADKVVAIDISKNMIEEAKQKNADKKIDYMVLEMEKIGSIQEKFDFVYSSLAFHYIQDFNKLLFDINKLLNPSGILLFSQESPLLTAIVFYDEKQQKTIELNGKTYYLLSDYENETKRENVWNDNIVTKYHRTYSTIVNNLIQNGFEIELFQDSYADEKAIKLKEKYKYEKDRPMFLFVKARKKKDLFDNNSAKLPKGQSQT